MVAPREGTRIVLLFPAMIPEDPEAHVALRLAPHWWQWPTVLSLDAPAVAVLWQWEIAQASGLVKPGDAMDFRPLQRFPKGRGNQTGDQADDQRLWQNMAPLDLFGLQARALFGVQIHCGIYPPTPRQDKLQRAKARG